MQVTDVGLTSLATHVKSLKHLSLLGLNRVTDDAVVALAAGCAGMETLAFSPNVGALSSPVACAKVGDRGFVEVAAGMPKLTTLHLAGMRRLTDTGMVALAKGCTGVCV